MSMHDQDELFGLWLEDKLDDKGKSQFEQLCRESESFSERVALARKVELLATEYNEYTVPSWNPSAGVVFEEKTGWWQWQWLPVASLVTSCLAIFLVIMRVELHVDSGAMTLSFPEHRADNAAKMLATQFEKIQQDQSTLFMKEIERLRVQQSQTNDQLVSYIVNNGRNERKEDFNQLVKYINELRRDDQLFYAQQMMSVREELKYQDSRYLSSTNASYPINHYPNELSQ